MAGGDGLWIGTAGSGKLNLEDTGLTNPFESIECCFAFQVRDMDTDRRDAWAYYIAFGFDPEFRDGQIENLRRLHGWTDADFERLETLHKNWGRAKRLYLESEEVER